MSPLLQHVKCALGGLAISAVITLPTYYGLVAIGVRP